MMFQDGGRNCYVDDSTTVGELQSPGRKMVQCEQSDSVLIVGQEAAVACLIMYYTVTRWSNVSALIKTVMIDTSKFVECKTILLMNR